MSRGLGKTERTIIDFLETSKLGAATTLMIGGLAFGTYDQPKDDNNMDGRHGDPVKRAKHHAKMQSIRRALRRLEAKGLVEGYRHPDLDAATHMSAWVAEHLRLYAG